MNDQQAYVFNQYYIDFLKKVKGFAKEQKDAKKEARDILRTIKKHFSTMDKLSMEYVNFLDTHNFWDSYRSMEDTTSFTEEFQKQQLYLDISISDISTVLKDGYILRHYLCLLDLFHTTDLPVDPVLEAIKSLNQPTEFETKLEAISHEVAVYKLKKLRDMHKSHTRHAFEDELKDIESTSLGKLAKEIMGDINIEELQKTMSDPNMNIFASLQDPNSGFGKVLSTVSQKMLSKIGSGELQQETLLQDAVNLASKIPNMIPGGMGSQLGNIGNMLGQLQKMGMGMPGMDGDSSKKGGMNPMDMMQAMMSGMGGGNNKKGGMNPMDMMQAMMGGMNMNGAQKSATSSRVSRALKKQQTSDRLKKKLQKHRENNIQREVEKDHE